MNVVNKITKTEFLNWKELIPFQPDNFKKTDPRKLKKLVESYKKNGKLNPFAVWEHKGKIYIIDGHATQEVFSIMESEGISIPDKFPCIFLDLKDKKEAKKAVLVYNSHYRKIDGEAAFDWIQDLNFEEIKAEIEIPELQFSEISKSIEDEIIEEHIDHPFKTVHFLISIPVSIYPLCQELIQNISQIKGVEIEQGSN